MMNKAICILIVTISFCINNMAQDTLIYEIKAGKVYLGDVVATQANFNNDSVRYRFESYLKVFGFYNIHYLMESVFTDSILQRALCKIDVNDERHHFCITQKKPSGYTVTNAKNDSLYYKKPILSSVTPYYFNNYLGPDTIFSEFSGRYRAFVKQNDTTYILDPDDPMEFYLNDKHIVKVTVPNTILDFHIELKTK